MFLKEMKIENFRGIEELTLQLDEVCVFIGENNAGKSSILDAIRLCLKGASLHNGTLFEVYDYHLEDIDSDPTKAEPIKITLTFTERYKGDWTGEIANMLSEAMLTDEDDLARVILRASSRYDQSARKYITEYHFLDWSGDEVPSEGNELLLANLSRFVPVFYLPSSRDAAHEFRSDSRFWSPFVRALELDEAARTELENALSHLNQMVMEKHPAFEEVKKMLRKTTELLPHGDGDPLSIDAVPSKHFDILARAQVNFSSKTSVQIPMVRHGSGTQSLAIICLFNAFLQRKLKGIGEEHRFAILALEEPEAHLHPSAISAVGEMLSSIPGQKIITTHSGKLLASVPLKGLRRLRRRDGKITVHRFEEGSLEDDEFHKLDYQIRATRGDLLISRCWLLVEGETEAILFSECARAMNLDLQSEGISCVEFRQVGLVKFIKLADQLGIEWIVLCDNDPGGLSEVNAAKRKFGNGDNDDQFHLVEHGSIEVFLCMNGFGDIYMESISDQKTKPMAADSGSVEYWNQVCKAQSKHTKIPNVWAVAKRMNDSGSESVPDMLKEVIERARTLAKQAG